MSLRERILRGLAWKLVSQVVLQGSRLVVAILLARLLAPHDYGLAAMVLVCASLVLVFSDVALGAALIQRRELSEADRSTVFWAALAVGAGFTVLGVAVSGPVAAFYGEPEVRPLLAVLSLSFVLTSLGTTQSALLQRELDFRRLELRLIAATLAGATVGVLAAVQGAGAWAIVAQQLTATSASTALLWLVSPWRPRWTFSRASLRSLAGFSGNVFGQRLLYYLHVNFDKVLVGRLLGPAALGVYGLASSVILVPFSRIAVPVAEVLFPAFSKLQGDRRQLAETWIRASRLIGAVSLPALVGLAVVAPDFVRILLGPEWHAATPVIQALVLVGALQSLQTLNSAILQALDRTRTLLRYALVFFGAHAAAFIVGIHWGILGVAVCYAVSSCVVEPLYAALTARALGIPVWDFFRGIAGVAQAAVATGVLLAVTRHALVDAAVPPGFRLLALTALGIVLFAPLCLWRAPELRRELRLLRRRSGPTELDVRPAGASGLL